jgi:hypothetical protein
VTKKITAMLQYNQHTVTAFDVKFIAFVFGIRLLKWVKNWLLI